MTSATSAEDRVGIAALHDAPTLRLLLAGGTLCNDASVAADGSLSGDPTEAALVAVGSRYGLDKDELEAGCAASRRGPVRLRAQADDDRARLPASPEELSGRAPRRRSR